MTCSSRGCTPARRPRSSSPKTCFFTPISSNTASSTKSQSSKPSYEVVPVTIERRKRALSSVMPPARGRRRPAPRRCPRWRSRPRPGRGRGCTSGSSSRRTNSAASWRAISPAPRMPTFLHLARLGVGHAHLPLRAPLHEIERVERGLRLAAEDQVGDRLFLLAVALFDRPARRSLDQVERAVRRDRCAVDGVVELRAGAADRLLHLGRVRRLPLERRARRARARTRSTRRGTRPARGAGRRARTRGPRGRSASCSAAAGSGRRSGRRSSDRRAAGRAAFRPSRG